MCAKRIVSEPVERESIQEVMMRARLLEQQALREADPVRRSSLQTEAAGLRSEGLRRLRHCVVSHCGYASGE